MKKSTGRLCFRTSAWLLFLIFMTMPCLAFAVRLDLGSTSGLVGGDVTIPITLNYEGTTPNISATSNDIAFDPALLDTPRAAVGPAGTAASKQATGNTVSPGVFRVGVFGLNQNIIQNGVVALVTFRIRGGSPLGDTPLTNTPSATDPGGTLVSVLGIPGLVTIHAQTAPKISPSPASKDFGLINVGSQSGAQIFQISNTGDADLALGTITLSGTDISDFKIIKDLCSAKTLIPAASCTVKTAFSPLSAGLKSADLSIPSNDPTTATLAIALTGEGTLQPVFGDCQEDYWAEDFINALSYSGVTTGCGAGNFCPENSLTRKEMAAFIISAIGETGSTVAYNAYFTDVANDGFAPLINRMKELGIAAGCGASTFCPNDLLTRAQMAVFITTAMGETESTAVYNANFDDIANDGFAPFVNRMNELGITGGCGARAYCPGNSTNRAMMAVFLGKGFLGM